jgi:hypothetical protein
MKYVVDGKTVNLDDTLLLGKGVEKAVYRHPGDSTLALAVYHDPSSPRAQKLKLFFRGGDAFPRDLATIPLFPVNQGSSVVGFGMQIVGRDFQEYQSLFRKSFCENNGITPGFVAGVALRMGALLNRIHAIDSRVLVGDLNARAIMFNPTSGEIAAVDVDSWNLPGAPCIVATPSFGCPDLFGKDLRRGQNFEQWMDWYSFSVLLINGLLRQHPFIAGIHPTVNDLIGRATKGITCFDSDVTYPRVALPPEILSDDLLHQCIRHLKRADRGPFDLSLIEEYQANLVRCGSCSQWYHTSRRHCPKCSTVTQVTIVMLTAAELLALGPTEVIAASFLVGDKLYCVIQQGLTAVLKIVSIDGASTVPFVSDIGNRPRGSKFGYFDGHLVVAEPATNGEFWELSILRCSSHPALQVCRTSTEIRAGGHPAFATGKKYLYRTATGMLMCDLMVGDELQSRPICSILRHQTWFVADANTQGPGESVVGFLRHLESEIWFVLHSDDGGPAFSYHEIALSPLNAGEALREVSVRFFDGTSLIVRKIGVRGKEFVEMAVVSVRSGRVIGQCRIDPLQRPEWSNIHGKAVASGKILHATDQGIIKEVVLKGSGTLIPGSAGLVDAQHSLQPYEGGRVLRLSSNSAGLIAPVRSKV